MNWLRRTENDSRASGFHNSEAINKTRLRRAPALKQLAAGARWTVRSWVTPAGSGARWEQSQNCKGAPGDNR